MAEQEGPIKMKRVLFVISYLDKGGAERVLSNITIHFPQEWDIDILVNDDRVIDYPFRGSILTLGIKENPKTDSVFFQLKVLLKRIRRLRQLKKRGNYQACVSFLDSANVANILSGKRFCRIILSVHSSLKQSAKLPQYKYIVNPLVRLLYNYADRIVAVSEGVRKELVNYLGLRSLPSLRRRRPTKTGAPSLSGGLRSALRCASRRAARCD